MKSSAPQPPHSPLPLAPPASHCVRANGLDHHLLEWPAHPRDASGATALLLHGFMDAAGTWDLVAPALAAAGLRVLAPDMRGFGGGPRVAPGGYYHFPDYVGDVAALVDSLEPGCPLFLVGHSMGGTVASLYAGALPERVTRLALLEGVGPPDHPNDVAPDRMRRWLEDLRRVAGRRGSSTFSRSDAMRRLVINHPSVDPVVLASRLPHLTRETPDGRLEWLFDPLHKTTSPSAFFAKSYMAFARRVTCPVLFVGGGPLGYHPPDEDERVAAFPAVERLDIADAGHMVHWTRPDILSAALIRFWQGG